MNKGFSNLTYSEITELLHFSPIPSSDNYLDRKALADTLIDMLYFDVDDYGMADVAKSVRSHLHSFADRIALAKVLLSYDDIASQYYPAWAETDEDSVLIEEDPNGAYLDVVILEFACNLEEGGYASHDDILSLYKGQSLEDLVLSK